ncbi:hypothetical protein [Streptomyces sp. NPDC059668]|uniref:hypothetical protein n=1 Tax=Streptomyces sp. NPDC059668 TaxID=3346900 RepID=UPI003690EEB9
MNAQTVHGVGIQVSYVDALPNGRLILAQGRQCGEQRSAQIFGRDGRHRKSFQMGDAVEFMMTDRRNHIWSAYFDEGVYADPVSAAGLARWDSGGQPEWRYSPPAGVEYIDTVYALNAEDGVTWACYYPTFPLLEVRTDGQTRVRTSPVVAPLGIAVKGDEVAMLGGNRRPDQLQRCRITDREIQPIEEAQLTLPGGGTPQTLCASGRAGAASVSTRPVGQAMVRDEYLMRFPERRSLRQAARTDQLRDCSCRRG